MRGTVTINGSVKVEKATVQMLKEVGVDNLQRIQKRKEKGDGKERENQMAEG